MMLDVNGIRFAYKSTNILDGVDFDLGPTEVLSILGPNGVGKTTLLKCINGILRIRSGAVMVQKEDLSTLSRTEVAKRIGYVPQRGDQPRITVFDAVLLGRKPHITWDVGRADIDMTNQAIKSLGLEDLAMCYIDEISGGEFQKVQIARALVQEPNVILLDEPTSSLDLRNQHRMMRRIVDLVKGKGLTAVMSMHDLNLALRYSDKFIMLKEGRIFAAGGSEVVTPENIEHVYEISVYVEKVRGHLTVVPC
ncbi:MAG: ABC transporter ATP-binding protein [Euryarchaeota archaeon]|nr:ABC transporter ATP-binding protein [Euryarchaeota archaeon]